MVAAVQNQYVSKQLADNRFRLGICVSLAGVLMLFTALTSAYIVRAGDARDWQPLAMPQILLLSTALILISSGTLEFGRRQLKGNAASAYQRWLLVTVLLGTGFLGSQLLAWKQLARQGVYLASNPHSSFFYLLTAMHGFHLLGGLLALAYLALRIRRNQQNEQVAAKQYAITDAVTIYWHFMDGLWIYLFLLLFLWR